MKKTYQSPTATPFAMLSDQPLNAGSPDLNADGRRVTVTGSHGHGDAGSAASRGRGSWSDDE